MTQDEELEKKAPRPADRQYPLDFVPPPEDFLEFSKKRGTFLYRPPKARDALPAVTCILLFFITSLYYWNRTEYSQLLWVSHKAVFEDHEYWRLLTALFTHSDMAHVTSNSGLFFIFGWLLRSYFGLRIFPFMALVVGVLGNLLTIYYYPPLTRLVGASGMVYGMIGLWLTFLFYYDRTLSIKVRIGRIIGFGSFVLIPSTFDPQTSYLAHGAGFVLGIGTGIALILLNTEHTASEPPQVLH